mmetsp:Transcript_1172/g.4775  ORF Transcript_1172/g.4775 Transcript_1172/m.4775 type:complete len:324 (-) Transcript_1172:72-1043(-)
MIQCREPRRPRRPSPRRRRHVLAERARRPRAHRRRPGDVPRRVQQREIRPHLLGDEEKTRRARARRVLTPSGGAKTIVVAPFAARAAVERHLGERAVRGGDEQRELDGRRDGRVRDDAMEANDGGPSSRNDGRSRRSRADGVAVRVRRRHRRERDGGVVDPPQRRSQRAFGARGEVVRRRGDADADERPTQPAHLLVVHRREGVVDAGAVETEASVAPVALDAPLLLRRRTSEHVAAAQEERRGRGDVGAPLEGVAVGDAGAGLGRREVSQPRLGGLGARVHRGIVRGRAGRERELNDIVQRRGGHGRPEEPSVGAAPHRSDG